MNIPSSYTRPTTISKKLMVVGLLLLLGLGSWFFFKYRPTGSTPQQEVLPVKVATVALQDIPQKIIGIGTVTPMNTATVQSRVDGTLVAVHFSEGQYVNAGDLLAEIDPRPFEIQLKQAEGALARNFALLTEAKLNLARYKNLRKEESVSIQQLQAQEALVGQYEGAVLTDQATIDDAKLQLIYSRVTAPITGKAGLKLVDIGSMIRASGTNSLVTITQTDPMSVLFTLVEKQIPDVQAAMKEQEDTRAKAAKKESIPAGLKVEVWDQENKEILGIGYLLTLDNQINTSTGTVKAKAIFPNADERLFPNQFVNVRLLVRTLEQSVTIPTSAVQRGAEHFFVFTVHNSTAIIKNITMGYSTDTATIVNSGLTPGEIVVIDGIDRLRDKTPVSYQPETSAE